MDADGRRLVEQVLDLLGEAWRSTNEAAKSNASQQGKNACLRGRRLEAQNLGEHHRVLIAGMMDTLRAHRPARSLEPVIDATTEIAPQAIVACLAVTTAARGVVVTRRAVQESAADESTDQVGETPRWRGAVENWREVLIVLGKLAELLCGDVWNLNPSADGQPDSAQPADPAVLLTFQWCSSAKRSLDVVLSYVQDAEAAA
jgi:hypothetical protein